MENCTCLCGCQNRFEEIPDKSLALLIALTEGRISHNKKICSGCRYGKHRTQRLNRTHH